MSRAPLSLLPVVLLGCGPGLLEDLEVDEAWLSDLTLFYTGAVAGVEVGGATLRVTTAEGARLAVPVTLAGPRLGLVFDLAVGHALFDLPLLHPAVLWEDGSTLPGTALVGTYQGIEYAADVIVGVHQGTLGNEFGVQMEVNTLDFGVTGSIGYTWLTLSAAEE